MHDTTAPRERLELVRTVSAFYREQMKGAKRRRVGGSTVMLRGETLNLVSCDAPLPSSLKYFLFRFAPLSISQKSLQRL